MFDWEQYTELPEDPARACMECQMEIMGIVDFKTDCDCKECFKNCPLLCKKQSQFYADLIDGVESMGAKI